MRLAAKVTEAEQAYRLTLRIWEGLVEKFPKSLSDRREAGQVAHNLGLFLNVQLRPSDAEKAFRRASNCERRSSSSRKRLQKIGAMLPTRVMPWASPCRASQADARMPRRLFGALEIDEFLLNGSPDSAKFQNDLGNAHGNLAHVLLDENANAAKEQAMRAVDFERAAHKSEPANLEYVASLRTALWILGETLIRLKQHKPAIEAAEEAVSQSLGEGVQYYFAARYLTRCSSLAAADPALSAEERSEISRRYADRAVSLLREAARLNYRCGPAVRYDSALDPIRSRRTTRCY